MPPTKWAKASKTFSFVSLDYSGLELRLLAAAHKNMYFAHTDWELVDRPALLPDHNVVVVCGCCNTEIEVDAALWTPWLKTMAVRA